MNEEEYTLPKSTTFEEALKTSNKYENVTILCATDWTIGSDNMIAKRYVLLRYIYENGNESFHIGSQNLQFPNIFCEKFDTNNDYKIYFIGERTYAAADEQTAIAMAEQHLSVIPENFNIDISAVSRDNGI